MNDFTIIPTPEVWTATINGVEIPLRIWKGHTAKGIAVELHVLSVTPLFSEDAAAMKAELPDFMRPSRDTFDIKVGGA